MSIQKTGPSEERVVSTLCSMCATHCGIRVHVRENTIVRIEPNQEHFMKRLCVKSQAAPEMQSSKDRLLYPLKKVNGDWKRISWDEALDFIISKLTYIKEKYGSESLVVDYGHGLFNKETIGLTRRFAEAFGTPNVTNCGCICQFQKTCAYFTTWYEDIAPDVARAKCIVNWGVDPWNSATPARFLYQQLKEKGQKLIVIDPRKIRISEMADYLLRIRPGTDWALLLAWINIIISEELYDKDFVNKWTIGFDKLVEAVKGYTPQWAEGVTGIPADDIIESARMYATTKPATINSWVSLEQSSNTFQTYRAMSILIAITGNLDIEGGNRIVPTPPDMFSWNYQDQGYVLSKKTFSADRFPLWEKLMKEAQGNLLWETIRTEKPYPIKGLIVEASNPALTRADTNKFKEAVKNLDLFVVVDLFMTETAEFANIVLPGATGFEDNWLHCYLWAGINAIAMAQKVFEPAGECLGISRFWLELGRRMGYEDYFPWKNTDELIESILKPYGKDIQWMKEHPGGFFYAPRVVKSYERKGFRSPSGKMEIYSETLEKMGIDPLPVPYKEPIESPVSTPELFKEYPLMANAGQRYEEYEHSCWRNLPRLRSRRPDPKAQIHPKDAERYGVKHGEWVIIESPQGEVKMKADVTEDTLEGLVTMPHGWGRECNVNLITSCVKLDPIIGAVTCRGLACRIKKAD